MADSSPIPVVCALIEKDGSLLVAQRPEGKHLALKWEFPGGKVEPGESPEAALLREIREELSCNIELLYVLRPLTHAYGDKTIQLIPFVARLAQDSPPPHPHEHHAIRWHPPEELENIDLADADIPVLQSYLAHFK